MSQASPKAMTETGSPGRWQCSVCTFINERPHALVCEMCQERREDFSSSNPNGANNAQPPSMRPRTATKWDRDTAYDHPTRHQRSRQDETPYATAQLAGRAVATTSQMRKYEELFQLEAEQHAIDSEMRSVTLDPQLGRGRSPGGRPATTDSRIKFKALSSLDPHPPTKGRMQARAFAAHAPPSTAGSHRSDIRRSPAAITNDGIHLRPTSTPIDRADSAPPVMKLDSPNPIRDAEFPGRTREKNKALKKKVLVPDNGLYTRNSSSPSESTSPSGSIDSRKITQWPLMNREGVTLDLHDSNRSYYPGDLVKCGKLRVWDGDPTIKPDKAKERDIFLGTSRLYICKNKGANGYNVKHIMAPGAGATNFRPKDITSSQVKDKHRTLVPHAFRLVNSDFTDVCFAAADEDSLKAWKRALLTFRDTHESDDETDKNIDDEPKHMELPSKETWEINENDVELGAKLWGDSEGSFFEAKLKSDKRCTVKKSSSKAMDVEIDALIRLSQPNIVKLLKVAVEPTMNKWIVMEKFDMNVKQYLNVKCTHLKPPHMLSIARQCLAALVYLERHGVVHGNITASNVAIDPRLVCKLINFQASVNLEGKSSRTRTGNALSLTHNSFKWAAPEVLRRGSFSSLSDVWSWAVTTWEIFNFGKEPWEEKSRPEVIARIQQSERLQNSGEVVPRPIYKLLCRCWDISVVARPTPATIENELLGEYGEPQPLIDPAGVHYGVGGGVNSEGSLPPTYATVDYETLNELKPNKENADNGDDYENDYIPVDGYIPRDGIDLRTSSEDGYAQAGPSDDYDYAVVQLSDDNPYEEPVPATTDDGYEVVIRGGIPREVVMSGSSKNSNLLATADSDDYESLESIARVADGYDNPPGQKRVSTHHYATIDDDDVQELLQEAPTGSEESGSSSSAHLQASADSSHVKPTSSTGEELVAESASWNDTPKATSVDINLSTTTSHSPGGNIRIRAPRVTVFGPTKNSPMKRLSGSSIEDQSHRKSVDRNSIRVLELDGETQSEEV